MKQVYKRIFSSEINLQIKTYAYMLFFRCLSVDELIELINFLK